MRHAQWLLLPIFSSLGIAVLTAQVPKTFKGRIAPVPIDVSMQSTIAGTGSVTATLSGTKLSVSGAFEGLKSPATIARVHKSPVRGVHGPAVFDLVVTNADASSGTLSGSFDLNALQVADLEKGRFYVQVHSEKAPDGNLWGWLTPQETKR